MIFVTGDIHGSPKRIKDFCRRREPTEDDIIIIVGDVGCNYYLDIRDSYIKETFRDLKPTIFCIHGNHEARPQSVKTYKEKEWHGGTVMYEDRYPNILFAKDGEIFDFDGKKTIVIGGAYSVDKYYRISHGYAWFSDEQPTDEIKQYVEKQLDDNKIDIVLSHTCPFSYEPVEMFLPMIDQSTVDTSTEKWLDEIEKKYDYKSWYCGHWHTDKRVDKIRFLYHDFVELK